MRRDPNAAAGVGAKAERRPARSDDCGLAAAAAARRACKIIGMVGASVDQIVAFNRSGQFRHVGLAKENGASGAQPRHRGGIGLGNEIGAALGAAGADHAGGLQRILDGHRHAMQRALDVTTRQRGVGFVCLFSRRVGGQLDDGIEFWIDLGNLRKMRFDDGLGAKFPGPDRVGEFARRRGNDAVAGIGCRIQRRRDEILSNPGGRANQRSRA